jgi:hypothetical protein
MADWSLACMADWSLACMADWSLACMADWSLVILVSSTNQISTWFPGHRPVTVHRNPGN